MKVRLEIINDDGTKKASAEFGIADRHSQLAFLNIYADETRTISEPSSNSPNMMQNALAPSNTTNSQENIAGQNVYQPQFVQQPPVISQQPAQQVNQSQQYQQQYSQMPVQANTDSCTACAATNSTVQAGLCTTTGTEFSSEYN